MTFGEILDEIITGAFDASDRASAKRWVNLRYQQLYTLEEWEWRFTTAQVTVTADSKNVTGLPADFGRALSILNADGDELVPVPDPREFFETYASTTDPWVGLPEAFTVIDGGILVGPTSDETRSDYTLVYERQVTLLDADDDEPVFPVGHHYALVHGGKAEGYAARNMVLFAGQFEQLWSQDLDAMRRDLLETVPHSGDVWSGRYMPEQW